MKNWMGRSTLVNRSVLAAAWLLLFGSIVPAWGLDETPVVSATLIEPPAEVTPSPSEEITGIMAKQSARIKSGVRNGALTQAEAKTLEDVVTAVGEKMRTDFLQNKQTGREGLTGKQISHLKQMLNKNSLYIYEDKNPIM
jgi:hypothetical protein